MEMGEKLTIVGEDGQSRDCDVLLAFEDREANVYYVVYTDNEVDSEGDLNLFANKIDPANPDDLLPIEDEEELSMVEGVLDTCIESLEEGRDPFEEINGPEEQ